MDKRYELNLEVKNSIAKALFLLLETKSLESITIIELVHKAGVARASFYRNFKTKEDVISYYLISLLNNYKQKYAADLAHIARYENVLRTFYYVYQYQQEFQLLFNIKLGQMLLDAMNTYIIESTDLKQEKQLYKYPFYSYAGALYNVIYYWITTGCKETPEQITQAYFSSLHL
ncbi:MAG: TetR/AcrR family transcriptional regulator [Anaeroplasmataceae bacterium]|nr:TetR/AcrR family transcriptional regulator [Anaeroplasmataceae bacterium]